MSVRAYLRAPATCPVRVSAIDATSKDDPNPRVSLIFEEEQIGGDVSIFCDLSAAQDLAAVLVTQLARLQAEQLAAAS